MSQIRKDLIAAATAAGDLEYAEWVATRTSMSRSYVLVRLAFYTTGGV